MGGAVDFIEFHIDSLDSLFVGAQVDAQKDKPFVIEIGSPKGQRPRSVEMTCRKSKASPGSIRSRISRAVGVSSIDAVTWFRSLGP
jgi:hypothetical protein